METSLYDYNSLNIDPAIEKDKIIQFLIDGLKKFRKKGFVVGVSGGIDSSVVLALCSIAVGGNKVIALTLPEDESNNENLALVKKLTEKFHVQLIEENITGALKGFECYNRRNEAIKNVFPEFNDTYKAKIVLNNGTDENQLNVFYLKIISPSGEEKSKRIPLKEYLQIVAASNFKQRSRTNLLYYYAEANNYLVVGTSNKNEHEQGFFVKYGDGGADLKPITHLFKTQVFQLAEYLNVPEEIRTRIPTTDTYSAEQTQEEFFFKVPFEILDRVWYGWEIGISSTEIAKALDLEEDRVAKIISDINRKKENTQYLRSEPLEI